MTTAPALILEDGIFTQIAAGDVLLVGSGIDSQMVGMNLTVGGVNASSVFIMDNQGDVLNLNGFAQFEDGLGDVILLNNNSATMNDSAGDFLSLGSGVVMLSDNAGDIMTLNGGTIELQDGVGDQIIMGEGPGSSIFLTDAGGDALYLMGGVIALTDGGSGTLINCSSLGFFATGPVTQQTGGAATAGAVYTATEQGMLNRAYAALRAYGLLT